MHVYTHAAYTHSSIYKADAGAELLEVKQELLEELGGDAGAAGLGEVVKELEAMVGSPPGLLPDPGPGPGAGDSAEPGPGQWWRAPQAVAGGAGGGEEEEARAAQAPVRFFCLGPCVGPLCLGHRHHHRHRHRRPHIYHRHHHHHRHRHHHRHHHHHRYEAEQVALLAPGGDDEDTSDEEEASAKASREAVWAEVRRWLFTGTSLRCLFARLCLLACCSASLVVLVGSACLVCLACLGFACFLVTASLLLCFALLTSWGLLVLQTCRGGTSAPTI